MAAAHIAMREKAPRTSGLRLSMMNVRQGRSIGLTYRKYGSIDDRLAATAADSRKKIDLDQSFFANCFPGTRRRLLAAWAANSMSTAYAAGDIPGCDLVFP
jgi:hypothetical protein